MTKTKKIVFMIIALTALVYFINPIVKINNKRLENSISEISDGEEVFFNDAVPFKWDTIYTFDPYTEKERIEEKIGFKSRSIKESISEGQVQYIFVKNKRVVSSICAYPDSVGYNILFDRCFSYNDNKSFYAENKNDILYLIIVD